MQDRLFSGAYPTDQYPRILLDISRVMELKGCTIDQNLVIGAANTLTETIEILERVSFTENDFEYLEKIIDHLKLVAHLPVANVSIGNIYWVFFITDFYT